MSGNKGSMEWKGDPPSKDTVLRGQALDAPQWPLCSVYLGCAYSCWRTCMDIEAAVPWESRVHNQFAIFISLNITFLTLSYIFNL